jgi:hypothetical protein
MSRYHCFGCNTTRSQIGEGGCRCGDNFIRIADPVVSQPTEAARAAIHHFIADGSWPQPGTMPVCIRLGR